MTENTSRGPVYRIGELSRVTNVSIRTIRFYADEGLLDSTRSAGGHRIFDSTAVEHLRLVRRLRAFGLSLSAITGVLTGQQSVGEAIAAERAVVEVDLAELVWRHASLCAVDAEPEERAARLELLAAVQEGQRGHDRVVAFWRDVLSPMPAPLFDDFVAMNIPEPPADPTPSQVVAYASVVRLVADPLLRELLSRQLWWRDRAPVRDKRGLVAGVAEACESAAALALAGRVPSPGLELDRFVDAHAVARGEKDTPRFRSRLLKHVAVDHDPRIIRYWSLVGEISGSPVTAGTAHSWLVESLICAAG